MRATSYIRTTIRVEGMRVLAGHEMIRHKTEFWIRLDCEEVIQGPERMQFDATIQLNLYYMYLRSRIQTLLKASRST